METLESSRVCRLCGQQSGICINIFDKNDNHVKKINAVLPILVHEMDLLPKQMCHRCSYKLEEFHKFYMDCLKTDASLKGQLSWMRKRGAKDDIVVPMVQIENVKIKTEPPDYDIYELDPVVENVNYINSMNSVNSAVKSMRTNKATRHSTNDVNHEYSYGSEFGRCVGCKCHCDTTNLTKEALPVNCKNTTSRRNVNTTSRGVDLGISGRILIPNGILHDTQKSMSKTMKKPDPLGPESLMNITIKNEISETHERRLLRPRKQSVNYLGPERKGPRSIASRVKNPKLVDKKHNESSAGATMTVDQIKIEEPDYMLGRRTLRPRKSSINYSNSKKKNNSHVATISQIQSTTVGSIGSTQGFEGYPIRSTDQRLGVGCIGALTNQDEVQVKQELISEIESLDTMLQNDFIHNRVTKTFRRNLTNAFGNENKIPLKIPKKETDLRDLNNKSGTVSNVKLTDSKSKSKQTNKSHEKFMRSVKKQLSNSVASSPKSLRSQDLRLRNGKVKNNDAVQTLVVNMRKRLNLLTPTVKNALRKTTGNQNATKVVPPLVKTADDMKHFCEKCGFKFFNRELFRLHACYAD